MRKMVTNLNKSIAYDAGARLAQVPSKCKGAQ
jgi:hypothetical protein